MKAGVQRQYMWRGLDRITVDAYNQYQSEECEMFLEPRLHSLVCIYWVFAHELFCKKLSPLKSTLNSLGRKEN